MGGGGVSSRSFPGPIRMQACCSVIINNNLKYTCTYHVMHSIQEARYILLHLQPFSRVIKDSTPDIELGTPSLYLRRITWGPARENGDPMPSSTGR